MSILLFLGLILFVGLVVVHEFGHYIAARRNGVEVEEFGIGFPPRIWSKKLKNKTLFTLNLLPLGGFVRLKGEHDADTGKGSYGAASLLVKTKIMIAGVVMNLVTAVLLLTLLALLGLPKIIDDQFTVASDTKVIRNEVLVGYVDPDSPAAKAGVKERDQILAISTEEGTYIPVQEAGKLPDITEENAGQTIKLIVEQDGIAKELSVALRSTDEVEASKNTDKPKGYLGILPTEYTLRRSTWSAPIVGVGLVKQFTQATFVGLGRAVGGLLSGNTSKASEQVAGPVGIFVLIKDGSLLGYQFILMIVAVISLTLAIMNVLPIPALDGGRLFVTWLYRLMRRPLTQNTEEWIHGTGFALLMVLFVFITIVDVRRFF